MHVAKKVYPYVSNWKWKILGLKMWQKIVVNNVHILKSTPKFRFRFSASFWRLLFSLSKYVFIKILQARLKKILNVSPK